jgi:hypothetical protein
MALPLIKEEAKRIEKKARIKPVKLRAKKKGLRALSCTVV